MPKTGRQISLAADVEKILEGISEGQRGASAYVEDLVRDADREWRAAYALLRTAGWMPNELLASFEALNGWMVDQPPRWAAAELVDADRLYGLSTKWELESARWSERCTRIDASVEEAQALIVLSREFWRFNPKVEQLVRE